MGSMERLVGRRRQVDTVKAWFGVVGRMWRGKRRVMGGFGPLVLQGPPATGKSAVLQAVAEENAGWLRVVTVDCVACESERELVGGVAEALGGVAGAGVVAVDDLALAVDRDGSEEEGKVVAVVLDRAEWLQKRLKPSSVAALLSLPQRTRLCRLVLVVVCEAPWDTLAGTAACLTPLVVAFQDYTEAEAQKILVGQMIARFPEATREHATEFVRSVTSLLFQKCVDVRELCRICEQLYPRYIASNGLLSAQTLQRTLENLYQATLLPHDDHVTHTPPNHSALSSLARTSRVLLLAAYLASTNPAKTDTKYFTPERTRKQRRSNHKFSGNRAVAGVRVIKPGTVETHGRKRFSQERLFAIARALLDLHADGPEKTDRLCNTQVATLAQNGFLTQVGKTLDDPKFICYLDKSHAQEISKRLGVDLPSFTHDVTA